MKLISCSLLYIQQTDLQLPVALLLYLFLKCIDTIFLLPPDFGIAFGSVSRESLTWNFAPSDNTVLEKQMLLCRLPIMD